VQPQFGRAATPTFLFLYIALPVMKQCRDELMDLDLWNPLGQRAMSARDAHISWKKYTEFMPRAQVALMEIPIYATYSLLSDLDALCERIVTAEKRFREGPQKVIPRTGLLGRPAPLAGEGRRVAPIHLSRQARSAERPAFAVLTPSPDPASRPPSEGGGDSS
jgi:hypothetical protein